MTHTESNSRIGKVLDGRYRLDRLLGEGGVGAVYGAWHVNLTRPVAVKLLHAQFAGHGESMERFKREAQILSGLGHPAFVTVSDFGHAEDGTAYMVMEMIEGETLRERIQDGRLLSIKEVLALFRPLCEAMEQAHQRGILHRDLKPDNLMLPKAGGVKILDFGMAKLMSDAKHLTSAKVVMGTPNYLAPERARGRQDADKRSDIFALGAILYEALSGRFAFYGATPMDTMLRAISAPVAKLELADSELAKRLDEVIATACAKEATGRYQSAMDMLRAMEAALVPDTSNELPGRTTKVSMLPRSTSTQPPRMKAGTFQAILAYIRNEYGEAGLSKVYTELGIELVKIIQTSLPSEWIETREMHKLNSAINMIFDDGSLLVMRRIGYFVANMALNSVYKSFLSVSGPETFSKRAQAMLSMLSSAGETFIEKNGSNQWNIKISNDPDLTDSILAGSAGWIQCYLELTGAEEISVVDIFSKEEINPTGNILVSFK